MASSGSSPQMQPVQTQAQSKEPWSGAVPYLNSMMSTAEQMRLGGVGYQPWTGGSVVDLRPNANMALDAISGGSLGEMAAGGPAGVREAQALGTRMIGSEGIGAGQAGVIGRLGQLESGGYDLPMGVYTHLARQANEQQNPFLNQLLETMNRRIGDRVNASMSGAGRYGSGQHTDIMTRALAEAEAPVLAQDYRDRAQRAMMAAQGAQGITGERARIQGAISDIYGQGLNRAGQWAQYMPQLSEAMYEPARRSLGVEEFRRSIDTQKLADQAKLHGAQQAYPWEQLFRESAIVGGAGGLGGTTNTTLSQAQASPWQRILGGGIAGAGIGSSFGPLGTGVGALGGAALGGFL